jgi:Na+-transporting methylmalonyl-CoA/oxaloacetate decarboxylase beta subunit
MKKTLALLNFLAAIIGLAYLLLLLVVSRITREPPSIPVIDGSHGSTSIYISSPFSDVADGPTSIYLSARPDPFCVTGVGLLTALFFCNSWIIWRARRVTL